MKMGENNCWEREVLITELTKGKELMLQLQKHFDPMKQDVCLQYLAAEILSSYDKAMSLLNGTALSGMMMSKGKEIIHPAPSSSTASQLESPHLLAYSSTKSCGRPSKSRKRKTLAPRTEYVEARPGEKVPPEDGLSWRKYGQRLVLGEKYPRKYYRCAPCCCGATKVIRRIDTEPLTFELPMEEATIVIKKTTTKMNNYCLLCKHKLEELSDFYIREMVSTPNNSSSTGVVFSNSNSVFNMNNSDFIPTPTSSPHPLDNNNLTDLLFFHESSANDFNSPNHILKKLSFDHYLI